MSKIHIALDSGRFDESVRFYRAFLGTEPVKHKPGYAKFESEEPPLNLTLNERQIEKPSGINHLGIEVSSTEKVEAAARRLRDSGLVTLSEESTDCCYALQDKVWVQDPNGYRWEVFVVKVADTAPELELETSGAGSAGKATTPCC